MEVTGVGMNCCSIGSDSENTQGLLLYSLTVINNVVHWNLINIFKLCFDIFSSSNKSTCAAVWLKQSFNCLNHSPTPGWLCLAPDNKTTEIQMWAAFKELLQAPGVIWSWDQSPPSQTGLNPSQNVPLTLVKEFCSNGILEQRITVSLTLVSW